MAHPNVLLNSRTLIIGGSDGIGFAVASGALASGSRVHITSSKSEKLAAKIQLLQSFYPGVVHVTGSTIELSNTETLETNLKAVLDSAVKDTRGPLDHIVYTAGGTLQSSSTPLAETTASTALDAFTTRYLGPLLVGKLVAAHPGRYLTSAVESSITLTSGMRAHRPAKAFNAAMVGATEVLARNFAVELAPIRANVIIPGPVQGDLLESLVGGKEGVLKVAEGTLTKEVGGPEGMAEAYLFCMRSTHATGQGFVVDNGVSLV
ncbi:hypothetical protein C8F04DRAFT_1122791 [Mycena alexandri]|uniref:NAD(P)-binding protein n=1 Tax=Mycena alexandri TaxID=1745969 RepID=A0AAD6SGS6_9AGAR|nr:hypothetical protein C8F04DRAFT_1122791 [Mycena alexandri]